MKKFLAMLLSLVMVLSLFTACGEEEESRSSKKKDKDKNDKETVSVDGLFGKDNIETPPVETMPVVTVEAVKLSVGIPITDTVMDHDVNSLTAWVEETTGTELRFMLYTGAVDVETQIATTIAARQELPDVLMNVTLSADTVSRYGKDNYLLDLTPYFEDRNGASKVFWQRLEDNCSQDEIDFIYNTVMKDADTGKIYGVPTVIYGMEENVYKLNNFISADCENPDKAFEMMMLLWSEEGSFRVRYGEYGVNWDDADKGTVTVNGTAAKIKVISDPANQENTCLWHKEAFCTLLAMDEQA